MTHPALDALRRAHDELLLARLELRNGPHEYRAERMEVDEIILTLEATIADVMLRDFETSPEAREDAQAWERQTRAPIGKPVNGGF